MQKRLHKNNVRTRMTSAREKGCTNNVCRVIVRTKKGLQDVKKGLQGVDLQGVKKKVCRVCNRQGVKKKGLQGVTDVRSAGCLKKRSTGYKICRVFVKRSAGCYTWEVCRVFEKKVCRV